MRNLTSKRFLYRTWLFGILWAFTAIVSESAGANHFQSLPITPEIGNTQLEIIASSPKCREVGHHLQLAISPARTPLLPKRHVAVVAPNRSAAQLARLYPDLTALVEAADDLGTTECADNVDLLVYGFFEGQGWRRTHEGTWPNSLEFLSARPLLASGLIAVGFEDVETADSQFDSLDDYFGFETALKYETWLDGSIVDVSYEIFVEAGTEEHWIALLYRSGLVDFATRVPAQFAAVDAAVRLAALSIENENRKPRDPAADNHITTLPIDFPRQVDQFLRLEFPSPNRVEVLHSGTGRLKFMIKSLRGRIIEGRNFWESLRGNALLVPNGESFDLVLIIDGYYAAGLGEAQPPEAAFTSMDTEYYSVLHRFVEWLLEKMKQDLEKS